ncbi:MAG: hypothetical protein H6Q74_210 [Firmicutes bacterium]|nr:hypothetical protein [Bacillota bacterium]
MRNGFWNGMILGGILATAFTAALSPLARPRKKPLAERSACAIKSTTKNFMREARRTRNRIMKKM